MKRGDRCLLQVIGVAAGLALLFAWLYTAALQVQRFPSLRESLLDSIMAPAPFFSDVEIK